MLRHTGKISQTKTAWRTWLQSGSPVTYAHGVKLSFHLEYKGKTGIKSGSTFHPDFTWWPHQSCMIDFSHVVLVELQAKWSSRGLLFWYHITLFLRESCKGKGYYSLLEQHSGLLEGWNISGFAFDSPAVRVALAHPETPISELLRPQDFPYTF